MTNEGLFKDVQEKQTRRINALFYKQTLSETPCSIASACAIWQMGNEAVGGCQWHVELQLEKK